MNYHLFFGTLILVLLARLRLTFHDEGSSFWDAMIIGTVPLFVLVTVKFNTGWMLFFAWLLLQHPIVMAVEESRRHLNRNRLLLLLAHVVVTGFLAGPLFNWQPSTLYINLQSVIKPYLPTASTGVDVLHVEVLLLGLLLSVNEANIMIRWLLRAFNLEPLSSEDNEQHVDQQEYNTGRVIGMLERIFYFVFVLLNQYAAIGFLLTAKGVTRFQEFSNNRTFAEYVLIGTLLSALLAMVAGYFVKLFI